MVGRELFGLLEFVILSAVAMQWEVECPHRDMNGMSSFSHPVSGLPRPVAHSTHLQGVIFAMEVEGHER